MSDDLLSFTSEIQTNPLAGVSTQQAFQPLPRNDDGYLLSITKSAIKPYVGGIYSMKTEAVEEYLRENPGVTPGKKLSVEAEILEGEFQGRKVWLDFLLIPASDNKEYANFNTAAQASAGKNDLLGLIKRAGMKQGIADPAQLLGVQVKIPCGMSKNGKYNKWYYTVREDHVEAEAPAPSQRPVPTRVTATDEPPF